MTRRTGLTLIELLATLAIATLLLGATLVVLAAMGRAERADIGRHETAFAPERLREILTIDLEHARRCRVDAGGVTLQTLARLRRTDLELEHVPTTVRYEVRRVGQESWLVRVQDDFIAGAGDDPGGREVRRELVCSGVGGIALRSAGEGAGAKPMPPGRWRSVPRAVTVVVEFTDAARAPAEFTFRVRENL